MTPLDPSAGWRTITRGEARCPGTLQRRDGSSGYCEHKIGDVAKESVVRLRVLPDGTAPNPAALLHKCRRCDAQLEIQVLVAIVLSPAPVPVAA